VNLLRIAAMTESRCRGSPHGADRHGREQHRADGARARMSRHRPATISTVPAIIRKVLPRPIIANGGAMSPCRPALA